MFYKKLICFLWHTISSCSHDPFCRGSLTSRTVALQCVLLAHIVARSSLGPLYSWNRHRFPSVRRGGKTDVRDVRRRSSTRSSARSCFLCSTKSPRVDETVIDVATDSSRQCVAEKALKLPTVFVTSDWLLLPMIPTGRLRVQCLEVEPD